MLERGKLAPISAKQLAKRQAEGDLHPASTFRRSAKAVANPKRATDTGPKQSVIKLVLRRSGGICEWPACTEVAIHRHHRLNRKSGGRHGEMQQLINEAHWILHACLVHHAYVTSPVGERRDNAIKSGWLLLEGQNAAAVKVWTRHSDVPVLFAPDGSWTEAP